LIEDPNSEYHKYKNSRHKIVNLTNPITKEDNTQQKIKPKHGGGTGQQVGKFFIKPLSNRKRKRDLGDEDLDILRTQFGSNGDGVTIVNSRESTYDSQGGWH
jgi:hypothetical protein